VELATEFIPLAKKKWRDHLTLVDVTHTRRSAASNQKRTLLAKTQMLDVLRRRTDFL
jgi:hypothetical protein